MFPSSSIVEKLPERAATDEKISVCSPMSR